jgi:hypothetical protein
MWLYRFSVSAGYIAVLKLAVRHIECEYFSGTPLLFSDACQALDVELDLVHAISRVHDEVVAGIAGPVFEPECLTDYLKSVWLFVAQYLIARARSGTLRAFNLCEASVDVMRPYWSGKATEDWLNSDRPPAGVSK